ncbi:hypothetical protein EON66_07310 [archaeon]|nr:MAG: hypothetical protein EON66_07310 [archaeon]
MRSTCVHARVSPLQALLYRLNGDTNPLHADPSMAAAGGFEHPILHGLCSLGIACRTLVREVAGDDASRLHSIRARFTKHVIPGEQLAVEWWAPLVTTEGVARVHFQVRVVERAALVLAGGVAEFRAQPVDATALPRAKL